MNVCSCLTLQPWQHARVMEVMEDNYIKNIYMITVACTCMEWLRTCPVFWPSNARFEVDSSGVRMPRFPQHHQAASWIPHCLKYLVIWSFLLSCCGHHDNQDRNIPVQCSMPWRQCEKTIFRNIWTPCCSTSMIRESDSHTAKPIRAPRNMELGFEKEMDLAILNRSLAFKFEKLWLKPLQPASHKLIATDLQTTSYH